MGPLIFGKSHLIPLIERLNRYPVGLVDNEEMREILALPAPGSQKRTV